MTLLIPKGAMIASQAGVPSRSEMTVAEVFQSYGRYVFRVLRRLGVADTDAEDVFQDVFVIIHRKLPQLDPRASPRAWVYGICVRCAADYRKKARAMRARMSDEEVDAADEGATTPPDVIDQRRGREILMSILGSLPDDKREVFVLYVLEELPMPEIAEILGCPLPTAYSRLYAARKLVEDGIRRTRAQMAKR